MEYIFIINNEAGNKNTEKILAQKLEENKFDINYQIYITTAPRDATKFISLYCEQNPDNEVCFVACGGDGTLNEVASALVEKNNKYLAVLSYGSGNDFIKYYRDRDFLNIEKLFNGSSEKIDVIKVNDSYSINMCNVGFEAKVGSVANKVKAKGGKNSYTKGIIAAVFKGRYNKIDIYTDGEKITKGKMLLCSIANCKFAGGKYMCSPNAVNNDGLIDVCLFNSMSLLRFLSCLKIYEKGKHLEYKKIAKKRVYKQCKNVKVISKKPIEIVTDGEVLTGTEFNFSILPKAINFILPSK